MYCGRIVGKEYLWLLPERKGNSLLFKTVTIFKVFSGEKARAMSRGSDTASVMKDIK